METLAVIAVMVVISAVIFPAVFSIRYDLRMAELDAEAQQIYNSAQYRLTSLVSTGKSSSLATELASADATTRVTEAPVGYYLADGDSWSNYTLYHVASNVDSESSLIDTYLVTPESSVVSSALLTGYFVIEVSPVTGEVYSVYYWEDDATAPDGVSAAADISYSSISALRSRNQRKPYKIGYYGGYCSDTSTGTFDTGGPISPSQPESASDDSETLTDLSLSIVNSEELYCKFASEDFDKVLSNSTMKDSLRFVVTAKGRSKANYQLYATWQQSYTLDGRDGSQKVSLNQSDDEVDVILDSMRDGLRFEDIVTSILPGSDLDVTLSVYCDIGQDDPDLSLSSYSATVNSLFASYDSSSQAVECSAVRHLRNLDLEKAGIGYNDAFQIINYSTVELASDIDFDGDNWDEGCVSIQSRITTSGNGYNPAKQIDPLQTWTQFRNSNAGVFNGNGNRLINFNIGSAIDSNGSTSAGLFLDKSFEVDDLFIEDPVISGSDNVGGLAGAQVSGTTKNVHVYSAESGDGSISGTGDNVGGLFGTIRSNGGSGITDCSTDIAVSGDDYVGGLVGNASNYLVFSGCKVGYLKGDADSPQKIVIEGNGDYVGGIFGVFSNGALSDCQALADVSGDSYVGGVVGYVNSGNEGSARVFGDTEHNVAGSVTASGDYAGGISGADFRGSSSGDVVFANVSGNDYVGGLSGSLQGARYVGALVSLDDAGTAKDAPKVSSSSGSYVGGCFGQITNSWQVSDCTSEVNVSGASYVGGFAGTAKENTSLSNCSVHSAVASDGGSYALSVSASGENVGGLLGMSAASVQYSFAAADVSNKFGRKAGTSYGGLVGTLSSGQVQYCYASGDVTARRNVGGFIGFRDGGRVQSCFESGDVRCSSAHDGSHGYLYHFAGAFFGRDKSSGDLYGCIAYGAYVHVDAKGGYDSGRYGRFVGRAKGKHPYSNCAAYFMKHGQVFEPDYQPVSNSAGGSFTSGEAKSVAEKVYAYGSGAYVSSSDTYAFSSALFGKAFPYMTIQYNGAALPYYGDWPTGS
jgi:hypothetical protein